MRVLVLTSTLAALVAFASAATPTASSAQISAFANSTTGPIGVLTTSFGCPVQYRDAISVVNTDWIRNEYFMETLNHLISERIPERAVHAKGSGAFGYFEVTHDVTDLTKAKFLETVGKQTPVALRFSTTKQEMGGSEILGSNRGFSVKFYTEEGNWDVAALNNPVFTIRDPVKFNSFVHYFKRNPSTNLFDFNLTWDFAIHNTESFFALFLSASPYGTPDGWRHMRAHSIHTMQLANAKNETNFSRLYFEPELGIQNLTRNSTSDFDYMTRGLYDKIGNGTFPSWIVYMQPITLEQALNDRARGIDVMDLTREISKEDYPLRQVGRIVLNENPKNYFAQVEQLAFCPGNLVPGIVGAPDAMFAARAFAYRAAAVHRLGINFNKIPVNRPINKVLTYSRDGREPNLDNESGAPNYYPNSFNGPEPIPDHQPPLYQWNELVTSNADQVSRFFQGLSEQDKQITISSLKTTLDLVSDDLTRKGLAAIKKIDRDAYVRLSKAVYGVNWTEESDE